MNKKELKKIFKTLSKIHKSDEKVDRTLKQFLNTIAPTTNNYSFIEKDSLWGAMKVLEAIYDKEFAQDVAYWFYECKEGKADLHSRIDGKEYRFKTLDGYLDFLVDFNNKGNETR